LRSSSSPNVAGQRLDLCLPGKFQEH
jgi:hypothetical protein